MSSTFSLRIRTFFPSVHRARSRPSGRIQPRSASVAKLRWTVLLGRSRRRANSLSPIGWLSATASRIWKVVRTLRISTPVSTYEPFGPYYRPVCHPDSSGREALRYAPAHRRAVRAANR